MANKKMNEKETEKIIDIRFLENKLIETVNYLSDNLESNIDLKIDTFLEIRRIVNTIYFRPEYHNSKGFIFTDK